MTAKELRIGNWVWNEVQSIPVKVDIRILQDQVYADKGFKDSWKPIPLTEEILLKCGFERIEVSHEEYYNVSYEKQISSHVFVSYEDDFSCSLFGTKEDSINSYGVLPNWHSTDTVHGLQNLHFILTGQELKIEL